MSYVFPRNWFKSETNFVKANYLVGHSPIRNIEDYTDEDGNILIDDEGSRFSKMVFDLDHIDYTSKYWNEGSYDFEKVKASSNVRFCWQGSNVVSVKNLTSPNVFSFSFTNCPNLTSVEVTTPYVQLSDTTSFYNCPKLTTLKFTKTGSPATWEATSIGNPNIVNLTFRLKYAQDWTLSGCTGLSRASLIDLIENLPQASKTTRLALGSTNLAKLTSEEIAIATSKGWTLA